MKKILATTYAVNPTKGSEDGMGWNMILQIARFHKVIAITRENNQGGIEKFMENNPSELYENIHFLYYDLPYWMRFWKKGGRGAMLYYWMWQRGIVSFIKKQKIDFDIVHNLNFHNDWTPTYLWKLNRPMIWGPIGHHSLIPQQYLKHYAKKYRVKDQLTWLVKKYFWNFSLSLKRSKKYASKILYMNPSVLVELRLNSEEHHLIPSVATLDFGHKLESTDQKFQLISAGRLVPLKGFDLTIEGFAKFLKTLTPQEKTITKLVIVGSGPEEANLKELAKRLKISEYIDFIDWIERQDLLELYKKSDAFVFPSHEGAGMVVAEALSFGLPVVCLDNDGPGCFVNDQSGIKVSVGKYSDTTEQLAAAISDLFRNEALYARLSQGAREQFLTRFHWDLRGKQLKDIYESVMI